MRRRFEYAGVGGWADSQPVSVFQATGLVVLSDHGQVVGEVLFALSRRKVCTSRWTCRLSEATRASARLRISPVIPAKATGSPAATESGAGSHSGQVVTRMKGIGSDANCAANLSNASAASSLGGQLFTCQLQADGQRHR